MITGSQIRAARALLDWAAEDLALASMVGIATIRRAERHTGVPNTTRANLEAIERALRKAGVEFVGRGVTFRDLEVGDLVDHPFSGDPHVGEICETKTDPDGTLMVRVRYSDHEIMGWTSQLSFHLIPHYREPNTQDAAKVLGLPRRK
jgi:transcriptional regulator with XRE-family HTH domain